MPIYLSTYPCWYAHLFTYPFWYTHLSTYLSSIYVSLMLVLRHCPHVHILSEMGVSYYLGTLPHRLVFFNLPNATAFTTILHVVVTPDHKIIFVSTSEL